MYQFTPQQPEHQPRYTRTTVYKHAKNVAEFLLIMSLSTGLTFLARMIPSLWIAVIVIKIVAIIYLIALGKEDENKRLSSFIRGAALLVGFVGGIWDIAFVLVVFNNDLLTRWIALGIGVLITVIAIGLPITKTKFSKNGW